MHIAEKDWIADKVDSYCWGMSFYQILTKKTDNEIEIFRNNLEPMTVDQYQKFLDGIESAEELKGLDDNNLIKKALVFALQYDPHERYDFEKIHELLLPLENEAYLIENQTSDTLMKIGGSYSKFIGNKKKALFYGAILHRL